MKDELFICGMFSLLDSLLQMPIWQLLDSIPVADRVRHCLVDHCGPHHGYLELTQAIEQGNWFDIRAGAEALMLGMTEVNHALLRALDKALQLE